MTTIYDEIQKKRIYKWVDDNRYKYNPYQREKAKEYYHNNPNVKSKKQRNYETKKVFELFRNILIES
jgi:hypothetical protein